MKRSLADSKIAADAAKEAAAAAKASVEIAVNSQRAWLITEVTFARDLPDITGYSTTVKSKMVLKIANAGQTPAEMLRTRVLAFVYPSTLHLPDEPVYGNSSEKLFEVTSLPGEIIPSGEKRSILAHIQETDLLTAGQIAEIQAGEKILFCYGKIEYRDISGSERVTQFGYYFYARKNQSDDRPEAMYRMDSRNYNYTS